MMSRLGRFRLASHGQLWVAKPVHRPTVSPYGGFVDRRARCASSIPDVLCYRFHDNKTFASNSITFPLYGTRTFASDVDVDDDTGEALDEDELSASPSVEEQYSRKTPLEHVLLRPGMYVGPNERLPPAPVWVLDPLPRPPPLDLVQQPHRHPVVIPTSSTDSTDAQIVPPFRMVKREYGLVPALIKVFDEILVNASDNRLRSPKSCTRIDVVIDPGNADEDREPFIRVWNNGKGIPIHMHATENMYVPEMLFGHLLTGSNFDDTEKRLTGGRHGYGAKLANIFATRFTVEVVNSKKGLRYRQTWTDNMTVPGEPIVTTVPKEERNGDYTCVEFVPDLFRLTGGASPSQMADEDYAVMCRRVVDVAGCGASGRLNVTLNGQNVTVESFASYSQMYRDAKSPPVSFVKVNPRWYVGVGLSESGSLESISFVNGMATSRGGTHVNVLVQQITKHVQERLEKVEKELGGLVTPAMIKRTLYICCDTQIENPTFDSQMKENLTSSPATFGSSYSLSASFLKTITKSAETGGPGIVEELLSVARGRQQANLVNVVGGKKQRRQALSIPKLEDAHQAGTRRSGECTLILTEGDSAKSLAVAGLEVIGRDLFGVFPLRGKLLNVRDAPVAKLAKNEEIKALCLILGLDFEKTYGTLDERQDMRYGRVLLMTDQDTDGSHIKGLVMNFFRCFWPKLLQPLTDEHSDSPLPGPPFLSSFVTPLLKVTKKGKRKSEAFYSMAEYNAWRREIGPDEVKTYTTKYYKGLGTSTPSEAKEYFAAFVDNLRPFLWRSEIDGECLDMVFDKQRASDRRGWILDKYDMDSTLVVDPAEGNVVTYEDFVNKEMIHFSHADNIRSIPSVIDGLKPSQRKVLYACFKRKLKSEIKVAQLTGYCAEHTAYHHGEASLQSTIIGMAQDFVGSNNVNLLVPSGQFGTRLTGGDDAASPRYIFTYLSPIARCIFPEADDALLTYRDDDGQAIEPEFYAPIIPLLLLNGSQGIGTGWSSLIPQFNPVDVLNYVRAKLDEEVNLPPIRPYARGFTGEIIPNPKGDGFLSFGRATKIDERTVTIDELPLRCWTNTYKNVLMTMRDKGTIQSFVEDHTTTKVSFTVKFKGLELAKLERKGLETALKLKSSLPTGNMHAFDANYVMRKYETPEAIVDDFFPIRLKLYEDRKSVLESEMNYNATLLHNKARFIQLITTGEIDLLSGRKSKQETTARLDHLGFTKSTELKRLRNDNEPYRRMQNSKPTVTVIGIDDEGDSSDSGEFDYLLNMQLSSLTKEKIGFLEEEAEKNVTELEMIKATSAKELWRKDLAVLAKNL